MIYGKGAKKAIPTEEIIADHAGRKAQAIWKLHAEIEEKLQENDQYDLYHELELPLAAILAKMETTGVKTDRETLLTIGTELSAKLTNLKQLFMKLQEKSSILIHLNS